MNRRTLNGPIPRAAPHAPLKRGSYDSDSDESEDSESSEEEDFNDDIPKDVVTRLCHTFSRQRGLFRLQINREYPERSHDERDVLVEDLCLDFERKAQRHKQGAESASFFASTQWVTRLDHKEMIELEANMRCFNQFVEEANRTLLRKTVAGVKSSLRLLLGVCADANSNCEDVQETSSTPVDLSQQNDCAPKGPVTITRLTPECNLSMQMEVTPVQMDGEVHETDLGQLDLSPVSGDTIPHASVVLPKSFPRPRIKMCEAHFVDADPNGSVSPAGKRQHFYMSLGAIDFFECQGTEDIDSAEAEAKDPGHSQDRDSEAKPPTNEMLGESTSSPLGLPEVKGVCGCRLFISSEKLEFDEEPIGPFGFFLPEGRKEIPVGILPPVPIQPDPG